MTYSQDILHTVKVVTTPIQKYFSSLSVAWPLAQAQLKSLVWMQFILMPKETAVFL